MLKRLGGLLSSTAVGVLSVVVVGMSVLLVVRAGGANTIAAGILGPLVLIAGLVALTGFVLALAGFDAEAGDIARSMAHDDLQHRLLTRWLERARWARTIGGFAGCAVWALAFQTRADVLVCGAVGILAGAVAAEMHHLRRPGGPRLASLHVRSVTDYLPRAERNWMIGVAVAAAITGLVGLVIDGRSPSATSAAGALLLLGVTYLAQRRVASRGRPALPPSLRQADDLARCLAIGRGLARPVTYASLALIARSLVELQSHLSFAPALSALTWLLAVRLWWRNRRLGLSVDNFSHREVAYT